MLSKRKLKNSAKNLFAALQAVIDPLDNQLGYMGKQETLQAVIDPLETKLEYTNNKKPSKPSLPHVLEPSKLLLPIDFAEPYLL